MLSAFPEKPMRHALSLTLLAVMASSALAEDKPAGDAPKADAPKADAPKIVTPGAEAPKADATKPDAGKPAGDAARTTRQDVSYQIGVQMGESVRGYKLDTDEVLRGIRDVVAGTAKPVDQQAFMQVMQKYQQELASSQSEGNKTWLAENAKKPGVKTTASGIQYEVLASGNGKSPAATDTVSVNYTGTLPDGKVFDASANHGGPATFPLNGVIKGWTEVLQLMKEGDKWRVTLPPELAYGTQGAPPAIPPNQILVFEIELLKVMPPAPQGAGPAPQGQPGR
jgi:FKBP-type peptidyl-prolyl cis-trans isomerase FklB